MTEKKGIAILGSTGSIGTQALQVIENSPQDFQVSLLSANNNADLLIEQALKHKPNAVVIVDESKYETVKQILQPNDIKVFAGHDSISQLIEMDEIDMVLNSLIGFSGLSPTIKTIETGKILALANKESLVVAGDIITKLSKEKKASILPVDSEHSAIFQCILGEPEQALEKVILTASGGPFLGKDSSYLDQVTKADALNHPNWEMGAKITIDSATMINKGFEVIEAKWLYDLTTHQIEVLIHPQSIIHSIVQFNDGSMKAQLSLPDMRLPIQYALTFPRRLNNSFPRLDLLEHNKLTFEKPDLKTFPNLELAYSAINKGGNLACVLNASNEIAVEAFLNEKIGFNEIYKINKQALESIDYISQPSLHDYFDIDKETRKFAQSLI